MSALRSSNRSLINSDCNKHWQLSIHWFSNIEISDESFEMVGWVCENWMKKNIDSSVYCNISTVAEFDTYSQSNKQSNDKFQQVLLKKYRFFPYINLRIFLSMISCTKVSKCRWYKAIFNSINYDRYSDLNISGTKMSERMHANSIDSNSSSRSFQTFRWRMSFEMYTIKNDYHWPKNLILQCDYLYLNLCRTWFEKYQNLLSELLILKMNN